MRRPSVVAAIVLPSAAICSLGSIACLATGHYVIGVWLACSTAAAVAALRVLW